MIWRINRASSTLQRVTLGLGATGGDPDVEFQGLSDSLDVSTGFAGSLGIWVDKPGGVEWLSVGGQYLRLQGFDYSETASAVLLGTTLTGTLDIEPTLDVFMVNAAARQPEGKFHPYIGAGIGFARSEADISAALSVNGVVVAAAADSDDDAGLAYQGFVGLDYDVTDQISLGVNFSYVRVDSTLFDVDIDFQNFVGMAVLGFKF